MSIELSLLSEIEERRDRMKAQHMVALKSLQGAIEMGDHANEGHYRGLELGIDCGLIHLDFLLDLAKQGES